MEVNQIIQGDCLEKLKDIPDNFVDAIVTDPPAGIGFMGKEWDSDKGGREEWITWLTKVMSEGLRVLKPGGHALVWALPRTSHWTGTALENAGFEVRDCVYHLFGSGFPKSLDISKAIDKKPNIHLASQMRDRLNEYRIKAGFTTKQINEHFGFATTGSGVAHHWLTHPTQPTVPTQEQYQELKKLLKIKDESLDDLYIEAEREITAMDKNWGKKGSTPLTHYGEFERKDKPVSDKAKQWKGWGTALKPAVECWWLVRKPLSEKTVAENVLKHGTGGLNIDATRVGYQSEDDMEIRENLKREENIVDGKVFGGGKYSQPTSKGRFPSHLIHDGSEVILAEFAKAGESKSVYHEGNGKPLDTMGQGWGFKRMAGGFEDEGSPARFFYTAKPSSSEKNLMYGEFEEEKVNDGRQTPIDNAFQRGETPRKNTHPTVKAQALMQYLIKLITPPKGIVLDMFAGSGSTLLAAKTLGHPYIGIEIDPDYCKIAEARMGQQVLNF